MFGAKVNSRGLEQSLKKLTVAVNKTADESIVEIAQLGSKKLAMYTDPYGISGKTKAVAEKLIFKDVNEAYDSIGQTYGTLKKYNEGAAIGFIKAINNGDIAGAENIARKAIAGFKVGAMDAGKHLEGVRSSFNKGHVGIGSPVLGLTNRGDLEQIKEMKKNSAGLAKAAWFQAGADIKSPHKAPVWLRKQFNLGRAKKSKSGWKTVVSLFNKVKYIADILSPYKINKAQVEAYKGTIKKMEKDIDKAIK